MSIHFVKFRRRVNASVFQSPVLNALAERRPTRPRPHAHWTTVTDPDGTSRLVARWHTDRD